MTIIFELIDNTQRRIYLTDERWKHIVSRHPELSNKIEEIKNTVVYSIITIKDSKDPNLHYYHTFLKITKEYLIVVVKYLNNSGFILTAFYNKNIKI